MHGASQKAAAGSLHLSQVYRTSRWMPHNHGQRLVNNECVFRWAASTLLTLNTTPYTTQQSFTNRFWVQKAKVKRGMPRLYTSVSKKRLSFKEGDFGMLPSLCSSCIALEAIVHLAADWLPGMSEASEEDTPCICQMQDCCRPWIITINVRLFIQIDSKALPELLRSRVSVWAQRQHIFCGKDNFPLAVALCRAGKIVRLWWHAASKNNK